MVPRAVQDVGYTAVGLGVLAIQQVQIRQREVSRKVGAVIDAGRSRLCQALRP